MSSLSGRIAKKMVDQAEQKLHSLLGDNGSYWFAKDVLSAGVAGTRFTSGIYSLELQEDDTIHECPPSYSEPVTTGRLILPVHYTNFDSLFAGILFSETISPVYLRNEGFDLTTTLGRFIDGVEAWKTPSGVYRMELGKFNERLSHGGTILSYQEGDTNKEESVARGNSGVVELALAIEMRTPMIVEYIPVGMTIEENPGAAYNPIYHAIDKFVLGSSSAKAGSKITLIRGNPMYSKAHELRGLDKKLQRDATKKEARELTDRVLAESARLSGRPYALNST